MKLTIKYNFISKEIKHFLYENFLNKFAIVDREVIYSILKIQNFEVDADGKITIFGYLQNCDATGLGVLVESANILSIVDDLESAKLYLEAMDGER